MFTFSSTSLISSIDTSGTNDFFNIFLISIKFNAVNKLSNECISVGFNLSLSINLPYVESTSFIILKESFNL